MHAHAFSRACVGGVRPGGAVSHRGSSPKISMSTTPVAAAAGSSSSSSRPSTSSSSSIVFAADLRSRRRPSRRATPLVPNSSLAGDAGTPLADSGGGGGSSGGGGKGLGGDGGSGDAGDSGSEGNENAPISAAAIAATVCHLKRQLAASFAIYLSAISVPARRVLRALLKGAKGRKEERYTRRGRSKP